MRDYDLRGVVGIAAVVTDEKVKLQPQHCQYIT